MQGTIWAKTSTFRLSVYFTLLLLAGCIGKNADQSADTNGTEADSVLKEEGSAQTTDHPRQVLISETVETVVAGQMSRRAFSADAMQQKIQRLPEPYYVNPSRENYKEFRENTTKLVSEHPVSTFSIDVDTASYSNVRRILNQGVLPEADVVRVEELVNYFAYDYPQTDNDTGAFSVVTEVGPSPWHQHRKLLHIGIKGKVDDADTIPDSNLVFLIDVSGSMRSPGKLELLVPALKMLTDRLRKQDRISIAVYAGAAGAVLEPTSGADTSKIVAALDQLAGGGSTDGGAGIRLAYSMARKAFIEGGINRVILATDGDFNVGTTDEKSLKHLIEQERGSGVSLTVLGFGRGNYNDALMQQLAQAGNGNAAYIDNINEARKVLVEEMSSTLHTIANDVKIQIEFNPQTVSEYRLIGYETRHLEREDFNNDKIDAGDIGAGHTVTAIYEISLSGSEASAMDPLRYEQHTQSNRSQKTVAPNELAYIKVRYKPKVKAGSILNTYTVKREDIRTHLDASSDNYRFSAAVAAFGQILKGGVFTKDFTLADTLALAQSAKGKDTFGYRGEFLNLVRTAEMLNFPQVSHR